MKSFLMIGQSNMAGRGHFGIVEEIRNPRCRMLRNGRWTAMSEPINPDIGVFGEWHSGVCLAASFADDYAERFREDIGLIPCAAGGTRLCEWLPGEVLYDHAVAQAKFALRSSDIAGILCHHGESDSRTPEDVQRYRERFLFMISSMKKEIGLSEDIPLILGELGSFMKEAGDSSVLYDADRMNGVLHSLAGEIPRCGIAGAEGLRCQSDGIHFDSVSLREFGHRYFREYCRIAGK